VLLDGNGDLITTKGRNKVDDIEGFPWPNKSLKDLLGNELVGTGGNKVATDAAIDGKVLGLYFSAHWCPPCRGFTPELAKRYLGLKDAGKNIEMVFVSSDRDEEAFNEYFGEMPWLALPYEKRQEKAELSDMFDVNGIPTLVFIGEDGKTITTEGRGKISANSFIEDFPYYPKPVNDISEDLEGINDHAALIVFMEALDDDAQDAACNELAALAKAEMARADDDRVFVFTAKGGGPVDKIRALVGKTGTPAADAEMVILDVASGSFHEPESDAVFSAASAEAFLKAFRSGSLAKNAFKQ
jgi:nucleoredoxin